MTCEYVASEAQPEILWLIPCCQ